LNKLIGQNVTNNKIRQITISIQSHYLRRFKQGSSCWQKVLQLDKCRF